MWSSRDSVAVLLELPVAGAGRRGVPSILPAGAEAELVPPESGRVRRAGPGLEAWGARWWSWRT